MCCFAVTHLLILGKSMISHANKVQEEDTEALKIEWPEDPTEKAKLIKGKAESMAGYVEAVSNSFITGWSTIIQLTLTYDCSIAFLTEYPGLLESSYWIVCHFICKSLR